MLKDIWRIENAAGRGFYSAGSLAAREMYDLKGTHPPPVNDTELVERIRSNTCVLLGCREIYTINTAIKDAYEFGFKSIEQLKRWVYNKEWRQMLKDEGFFVSHYVSYDAQYGDTQAVFHKADADLIETHIDITTI